MLPVAILMNEHRLIERMLQLIRKEIVIAGERQRIDMSFLDALVDFIQWYVDRTHHSKEEDILFKDVAKKDITAADRELLRKLIEEHDFGRNIVVRLVEAGDRFLRGSSGSLQDILDKLETLADFYQEHINKEDHIFFPAAMNYLNEQEQEAMIQEFHESDLKIIHAKYGSVVEHFEKTKR